MDVNEYERLFNITQMKVKEQHFHCCSTVHSHRKVFNSEKNSYCNNPRNENLNLLVRSKLLNFEC